ncbi:hypothetical protein K3495_g11371 [Podosphaera aphanis]|nr:hypothetical protein K3495_g11371 [Podosphaera aphanis]
MPATLENSRCILDQIIEENSAEKMLALIIKKPTETFNEIKEVANQLLQAKKEVENAKGEMLADKHALQAEIDVLNRTILNIKNSRPDLDTCILPRTAPHPDPKNFTGEDRHFLDSFLTDLNIKLRMNSDWWPNEQAKMGYVHSCLSSTAKNLFACRTDDNGVINCADVKEMIALLRVSFGTVETKEAAQRKLRTMYQKKKLLADFLPEWLAVASKTKYNDDAIISQLKVALNHSIVVCLSFLPSAEVASSLNGYLVSQFRMSKQ